MKISICYSIFRILSKLLGFLIKVSNKLSIKISNIRNYLTNTKFGGDI